MTTPLTFYPLNATSTTIPTAVALATAAGATSASSPTTPIGISLNWGEIALSGDSLVWAASGTEPAPTGEGACLDASTLVGQQLIAGNWNGSFKFFAGTIGASYTGTLKLRAWRYNSLFQTYTAIGAIALTSSTFDHTGEVFTFPSSSMASMSFPTIYDTAYIDLVFNCTSNTGSTSTSKVKVNISSSATLGYSNAFFTSPGFIPQKHLASRFLLNWPHKKLPGRFVQNTPHVTLASRFLLSRPQKLLPARFILAAGGRLLASRQRLAYAQDSFLRANTAGSTNISSSAGWATTLDGDTWSGAGSYTASISSNKGVLTGATTLIAALLGSYLVADGDVFVRFTLSNIAGRAGVCFRSTNLNNQYRVRYNNGAFAITKSIAGVTTTVATMTYTITAGAAYWVHGSVSGNILSGNIWADGTNEPAGFMLSFTDSAWTFVNGNVGLVIQNTVSGDSVSFDRFVATARNTTRSFSLASRLIVLASTQRLLASRYSLKSQPKTKKLKGRFTLFLGNTLFLKSRFNLASPNPAIPPPVGTFTTAYLGENDVPVNPGGYYTVNGQVLDTQPIVCTTPETLSGNVVLAGSTFTLVFDFPTTFTRSLLVDGTQVQMRFAIPGGLMVEGPVGIASHFSGRVFVVVCTLAEDVTISTRVITTPFF